MSNDEKIEAIRQYCERKRLVISGYRKEQRECFETLDTAKAKNWQAVILEAQTTLEAIEKILEGSGLE